MRAASDDVDVVVIGSGFGGSVAALRLTEKGYRVAVLESGRRFDETSLPATSWRLRRFLWAPALRCFGIQRIHLLRNVVVLAGAGVGGGSLVYANTLHEPGPAFYADPQWAAMTDWRAELAPFYDQARRMLGVQRNPTMTPADEAMRDVAREMGVGETFRLTDVGVFFGPPGTPRGTRVEDPFFGGAGPARRTCIECGECMTGCRYGAKNTLLTNYLHLAERAGAAVYPMTTATAVHPDGSGRYVVHARRTGGPGRRRFTARQVVFAAGALGTQRLLHRMVATGGLPDVSPRLGALTRTNSESLGGAITGESTVDYSRGVAITSAWNPDTDTQIQPVRYGHGSNAMGLLATLQTDGGGALPRWVRWLGAVTRHPRRLARTLDVRRWSERTVISLVMQSVDNSITVVRRRGIGGRVRLTSRQGYGTPNPSWIPAGNEAARLLAKRIGGWPASTVGEIVNIPMTAHLIGGAVIGDSPATGVVDGYQRLYGHAGLHVLDGAAVCANLGVNPSLTITAQAERAMACWANNGDRDPRPPLGSAYERIGYVMPRSPVVPPSAPGALRLPTIR